MNDQKQQQPPTLHLTTDIFVSKARPKSWVAKNVNIREYPVNTDVNTSTLMERNVLEARVEMTRPAI